LILEVDFSAQLTPIHYKRQYTSVGAARASRFFLTSNLGTKLIISVLQPLQGLTRYRLFVSDQVAGEAGEIFTTYIKEFYSTIDPVTKFPVVSDDELLDIVQKQTLKFFMTLVIRPVDGA